MGYLLAQTLFGIDWGKSAGSSGPCVLYKDSPKHCDAYSVIGQECAIALLCINVVI